MTYFYDFFHFVHWTIATFHIDFHRNGVWIFLVHFFRNIYLSPICLIEKMLMNNIFEKNNFGHLIRFYPFLWKYDVESWNFTHLLKELCFCFVRWLLLVVLNFFPGGFLGYLSSFSDPLNNYPYWVAVRLRSHYPLPW